MCLLPSMVSSYLVHHGYCATATAFARATETKIQEDQASIKNRQSEWFQNPGGHKPRVPGSFCRMGALKGCVNMCLKAALLVPGRI